MRVYMCTCVSVCELNFLIAIYRAILNLNITHNTLYGKYIAIKMDSVSYVSTKNNIVVGARRHVSLITCKSCILKYQYI